MVEENKNWKTLFRDWEECSLKRDTLEEAPGCCERETNKTLKKYYLGIMGFTYCLQELKVKDSNILEFLLPHGIFLFNCSGI